MDRTHTILVACAATKRATPTAARDLYTSALFAKTRVYAEQRGDRWFILSALHGLLAPDEVVAPYNTCLNDFDISARRAWSARVNDRLSRVLSAGEEVTILAGKRYCEFIVPFLVRRGGTVNLPLSGLGIGKRLQWLQRANNGAAQLSSN